MLRLCPARLCIYKQTLGLDQFFFKVCDLRLGFDKLLSVLPEHVSLSLQLFLDFFLLGRHLLFVCMRQGELFLCLFELDLQFLYLLSLRIVLGFELLVDLLDLRVQAVLQAL